MAERGVVSQQEAKELLDHTAVAEIYTYPIKSCGGISLQHAEVVETGVRHDRELMLMTPNGRFLSQRDKGYERLALVTPQFVEDDLLKVEAPDMPELWVPIVRDGRRIQEASVHRQTGIQVMDQGEDASRWFGEFLEGRQCQLVAMASGYTRQTDQQYALRVIDHTNFADGFQFLMTSRESLEDLNKRLPKPVSMNRFRPNIVISGASVPYIEDRAIRFQIGDVIFDGIKPCARCVITTTVQGTGMREEGEMKGQPLATLAQYRTIPGLGAIFGQNLSNENTGTVSVGDNIHVLEIGSALNFK